LECQTVQIVDALNDLEYEYKDAAKVGGVRTMVGVPLMRDNLPIGVFALARTRVQAFTLKEIELVTTFADQAVIAIENVRLFQELQSRTEQLGESVEQFRALAEVSQAVNSTLDLDQVLSTIVTRAVQLSATNFGAVYEYEEAEEQLRLRATYGLEPDIVEAMLAKTLRLGEGATGEAAQTRAPVEIANVGSADLYDGELRKVIDRAGVRSLLAIPLLREGRVLGALSVSRTFEGTFPAEVTVLLQTFAAQSAVAIQNARLFREIEQKSRELEIASQHKSQFLANMSHELRTPLNAILGYTELIVDKIYGEVPDKITDVLDRVQKSGRHLLGLINDVLDLSKIEAGQLTLTLSDYSVHDAVQSAVTAVEPLAKEKGLQLVVDIAAKLPVGRADERRIVQVLLNLIGNAIKFTEEGEVAIHVRRDNGLFVVGVSDTGPGIPKAQHERIFEEFQQADGSATRANGGTGLGLAIARKIIELHGGRLWVESVVGQGSTFTFSLPVQTERRELSA
jgi:signal transduction histidine kinase